mmetsp:Transcript_38465/g.66750  ORF Transcript_38465/g.66750 Transcript_38465/m.66750 type:complete len:147 (+) Transcript_38465:457-897(+)
MNEADSSFTAEFVVAHYDVYSKFTRPGFRDERDAERISRSIYNRTTIAAGRAAAEADQAGGDAAGEEGHDAGEMDVVEEAGQGAGAAVEADQPPPVAGGGTVAEAEAMEVVAGPGAGAGRDPNTPPPGNPQQEDSCQAYSEAGRAQ